MNTLNVNDAGLKTFCKHSGKQSEQRHVRNSSNSLFLSERFEDGSGKTLVDSSTYCIDIFIQSWLKVLNIDLKEFNCKASVSEIIKT